MSMEHRINSWMYGMHHKGSKINNNRLQCHDCRGRNARLPRRSHYNTTRLRYHNTVVPTDLLVKATYSAWGKVSANPLHNLSVRHTAVLRKGPANRCIKRRVADTFLGVPVSISVIISIRSYSCCSCIK